MKNKSKFEKVLNVENLDDLPLESKDQLNYEFHIKNDLSFCVLNSKAKHMVLIYNPRLCAYERIINTDDITLIDPVEFHKQVVNNLSFDEKTFLPKYEKREVK